MSALGDARTDIEAAAGTVTGVRVHKLGEDVSPPAVIVGPPRLAPLAACPGPGLATFPVIIAVAVNDQALESVWDLTLALWDAVENETPAVVTGAEPGTYTSGTTELPSYELQVEYPI